MPPTDAVPFVYLHGRFIPQPEAHLAINDAGFIFGATATDLCRTFHHRLFRLEDHLARFRQSCRLASIPQPRTDAELTGLAHRLLEHNAGLLGPDLDLALVMFATPGPIGFYLGQDSGPGEAPPTLGMHTFPLAFRRYARLFREGARLMVPAVRHVPAASVDPRAKQRSRLHWWRAEQEVHQTDPGASALLLDAEGYVTETAAANFLVVRDGTVVSPPALSILGGISLLTVQDLCAELKIPFAEQRLQIEDCLSAEEALLASTPYCLAGVKRINGVDLPWPGPILEQLLDAWSRRVGLDIRAQILTAR